MPRAAGFGEEVLRARDQRRQWLVEQGLADVEGDGIRYRRNLLAILQRRELLAAGDRLAKSVGSAFEETRPGDRIEGIYRRRIDLISGRFALIERAHDFTLVPWRPALEHGIGKTVSGVMREHHASWTIGRGRAGPVIS